MTGRKRLLIALTGLVGWANYASSQVPALPAPGLPGIAPGPAAPTPPKTLFGFLGLGKEQKEFCLRKLCKTPLGKLLNNAMAPIETLSGGLIPPFCPITPTIAELADPGPGGAAAKIMLDEAQAKARRAAVRYLGTVDCHYWPEAEEGLIGALRGDRNECVRYEAALALGSGCCCTKKTIEALTIVVSCSDRDGAPKETSERVHAAARMALDHCMACSRPPAPPAPEKPKPEAEGEKEKEKNATTPPVTPPVTPPAANDAGDVKPAGAIVLGEAKPYSPAGEAKPLFNNGVMQAVAKTTRTTARPVGFEYYAVIARTPMAPILAEARRVAAAVPLPASQAGDRSLVAMIEQAKVVPASEKVETGERTAEVVSPRPANLWDMMAAKSVPAKPASVVKATVPPPLAMPPATGLLAETRTAVAANEPKPMPMPALRPVASTSSEPKPAPMPALRPAASTAFESIPAPLAPLPVLKSPPATVKPADNPLRTGLLVRPLSPFNSLTIDNQPPKPSFSPTVGPIEPAPHRPIIAAFRKAFDEPCSKSIVSATLDDRPVCAPAAPKPAVRPACMACNDPPLPLPIAYTMQMPALPTLPISPPKPAPTPLPVVATERAQKVLVLLHNPEAHDERLQAICALDAADLASSANLVDKLLSVSRRSKDDTERKACIQALVRGKVTQPEVFATLGVLSKDTAPTVRVEATIALARLRVEAAK